MAIVAGICHGKQAAMADTYRQFHLFFVNGKSELDNSADLKKQLSETANGSRDLLLHST